MFGLPKDVIDGGTVPAANVEEARKLKDIYTYTYIYIYTHSKV